MAVGAAALTVLLVTSGAAATTSGTPAVDLGGTPLTRTSTDPGAPVPLEAGLWSDTLEPSTDEVPHQLVYRRTMADSLVHVGVVGAASGADEVDGVEVATFAADGTDCGTATASSSYADPGPFGAAVVVGASQPGERGTACGDTAEVRIEVGRGSFATAADLPVAIRVVEEAPATAGDPSAVEADAEPGPVSSPVAGPAEPVSGSSSFLDAALLESGTWSTAVATGSVGLYRVRLERGQSLAVGVEVPLKDGPARRALEDSSDPSVSLALVDPARDVAADVLDGSVSSTTYADPGDSDEPAVDGLPAVSWLQAFDSGYASLPGDYWVSLSVGDVGTSEPVEVPVELSLEVVDETTGSGPAGGPGEPVYPDVVTGPGGTAGPEGYAATTPFPRGP